MKSRKLLLCLTVWVSLILLVPEVQAQLGSIQGEVKDEQGNPIEGVTIRIEGMNVRRKYQLKTNKEGKFFHGGVSFQGTYRVIAQKEGYQSTYAEGLKPQFRGASGQDRRGVVDFVMKRGAAGRLAFEMTDEERRELMKRAEEAKQQDARDALVRESVNRGLRYFSQGRYDRAVEAFKEGIEKDDQQPALWARLGNSYSKLEQYDQALEAYQKAIALSPEDPSLYQNIGSIYSSLKNGEKAREAYDKAASLSALVDPTAAATNYYNMGVTYINSGRTHEAIEAFGKALEADPSHPEAHYQMGISLLGVNQIEKSIEHLKKYVELKPDGPDVETAKQLIETLAQ